MSIRIHPDTSLGHVHLTVGGLERQVAFYQEVLGLRLRQRTEREAALGAGGADLLRLSEQRGAGRASGTTGLYHLALLLPSRRELARSLLRLQRRAYANSPTDHTFTKSVYLNDPEGNGIELYAESPEDGSMKVDAGEVAVLGAEGEPRPAVAPLDEAALLAELSGDNNTDLPPPSTSKIGHINLHVANLERSLRFYRDLLGFSDRGLIASLGLAMVAAGGYHHHIALNRWQGTASPPPGSLGLKHFSIVLTDRTGLQEVLDRIMLAGIVAKPGEGGWLVADPSRNGILLIDRSSKDANDAVWPTDAL